ncbi:MAG: hypothetical protein QM726_05405 [Chitinophagaceae bacterium]
MPINNKYIEPLVENEFMHIYCKAVGNNVLFRNDENRIFFLKKYAGFTQGYFDTYSYILLDNHAHFLIKCAQENGLRTVVNKIPQEKRKLHQKKYLNGQISFQQAVELQCKDFFITYAMAYNKLYNRHGALFINPFRRVTVKDSTHFTKLIVYQHANVVKHGITKDYENYRWSSYQSLISNKPTMLKREKVLDWFGGVHNFIKTHRELTAFYYDNPFSIE